jgi:predicted DNA-binding antitoxin AbrB/MazE fold protein
MYQILNARYENGCLLLDEEIPNIKEGKKVKVIVFDDENVTARKAEFFASMEKHRFALPDNYRFNRDELYER